MIFAEIRDYYFELIMEFKTFKICGNISLWPNGKFKLG